MAALMLRLGLGRATVSQAPASLIGYHVAGAESRGAARTATGADSVSRP